MRYLLFVSSWLLAASCSAVYKKLQHTEEATDCISVFKPEISRELYSAQVNVTGKHLSGLVLMKTMPDSSVRVVFSGEAGFTFFDFEWNKQSFRVHYIFRKMNKKPVIKTLRKDFELVMMRHLNTTGSYTLKSDQEYFRVFPDGKDYYYYITDSSCNSLIRMERGNNRKRVVEAVMSGKNRNSPDTIGIQHHNFNFDIGLKRLYDIER